MRENICTGEPFHFMTRLHLTELTGLRAATLGQLVALMKEVPGASIYHHTHRFLQQHQYLSPEPPNDFAYWVTNVLKEDELGEKLASVDTVSYQNIRSLREVLVAITDEYLAGHPFAKLKFARAGDEFHFMKSMSFVLPTNYVARGLAEFADMLERVTIDSIYFHIFEARLRLESPTNDFSRWIEMSLCDKKLAGRIAHMDPYTSTMEQLRRNIVAMVRRSAGS